MRRGPIVLGGVGIVGAIGAFFANRKAQQTETAVKNAVQGFTMDASGSAKVVPAGQGITVPVRCTGYWPFKENMTAKERQMEGGVKDRLGKPLQALEDFKAGKVDFVSVAGDYTIWPYGQRISLEMWPGVVFRIVDTGGNFFGVKKVFRVEGREPLDICIRDHNTKIYAIQNAVIYPGDHFGAKSGPSTVQTQKIGVPQVGWDLYGVY